MIELSSIALGIATVIGAVTCAGTILLLHLLRTGYNPVGNAVSDYGVGRYRVLHHIYVIAIGISGLAMAIASFGNVLPESAWVIGFLILFFAVRLLIIFFPTDLEGQPTTRTGRIHLALAVVTFATIAIVAGMYEATTIIDIIGWIVVATAIILGIGLVLPRLKPIFGLLERLFYASMVCWFIAVGTELVLLAM
jgi:predicted neutral ceramidase superfamily lipid hydrolase